MVSKGVIEMKQDIDELIKRVAELRKQLQSKKWDEAQKLADLVNTFSTRTISARPLSDIAYSFSVGIKDEYDAIKFDTKIEIYYDEETDELSFYPAFNHANYKNNILESDENKIFALNLLAKAIEHSSQIKAIARNNAENIKGTIKEFDDVRMAIDIAKREQDKKKEADVIANLKPKTWYQSNETEMAYYINRITDKMVFFSLLFTNMNGQWLNYGRHCVPKGKFAMDFLLYCMEEAEKPSYLNL